MRLLRYTIFRLLQTIPVLIGVSLITFLIVNLAPGDPVNMMLQEGQYSPELAEAIEERFGLDRPLHERFITYMAGVVQGDLGHSIHRDRPVTDLILNRAGPTLFLVLSGYAFAIATSIPLGVYAATKRNEAPDHFSRILALFGMSTPSFWIGIVLILIFAVTLGILPSSGLVYPWRSPESYGYSGYPELFWQSFRHMLLPMVSLGTLSMAVTMRIERAQMVDSLQENYVKLARAYGVPERRILRKHAFRPAQLPVITIIGLNISTAIGGSVLIETVFNINGMGLLLIESIRQLDYQLVMGLTVVFATFFVIGVVITDISYAYVDPRVDFGDRS